MNIDYSIFVIKTGLNNLLVSIFVDDLKIMTSKESEIIQYIKAKHIAALSIIDMGTIIFK